MPLPEHADGERDGTRTYRRSVTLLGRTTSESLSPLAIARSLKKNSKLGARERKIEEAERRVDH